MAGIKDFRRPGGRDGAHSAKSAKTAQTVRPATGRERASPVNVGTAVAAREERGGMRLVAAFLDARGNVSVSRVAEHFGMSMTQIGETIGLTRDALYRTARLAAPKNQSRATEMLEIVARVVDWAGGEKQAMAWYRAEPLPAFGGRTAEALVKEGRAAAVRDYLDHVATGGFA